MEILVVKKNIQLHGGGVYRQNTLSTSDKVLWTSAVSSPPFPLLFWPLDQLTIKEKFHLWEMNKHITAIIPKRFLKHPFLIGNPLEK